LQGLRNLCVDERLISLPTCFPLSESEVQIIEVVVDRQVMIPLHDVKLDNVDDDLERNNDQLEENIVDKVVNFNAVVAGHLSLFVKQPE